MLYPCMRGRLQYLRQKRYNRHLAWEAWTPGAYVLIYLPPNTHTERQRASQGVSYNQVTPVWSTEMHTELHRFFSFNYYTLVENFVFK